MNKTAADKFLKSIDPDLFIDKAEGVWYLLGGSDDRYNPFVERCLHIVRLSDLSERDLQLKIDELTAKVDMF